MGAESKLFGWGLAAFAVIAMFGGILMPPPEFLQDIFAVIVLSLAAATLVIMPTAVSTAELKGFGYWLAVPLVLRLAMVGAALAGMLRGGPVSGIVRLAGMWWNQFSPLIMTIATIFLAAGLLAITLASGQKILSAAKRFRRDIFPLKTMAIHADFKAGILDSLKAEKLKQKVQSELQLFSALTFIARIMQFEIGVEFLCFIAVIFLPLYRFSHVEQVYPYFPVAAGLAAVALFPCATTAVAVAYLVNKETLSLKKLPPSENPEKQTFTLIDSKTGQTETVELLNPNSTPNISKPDSATEWAAEFEKAAGSPLIETLSCHATEPSVLYSFLANKIESFFLTTNLFVFASHMLQHLPVTIPVHCALLLKQNNRRVLLIDSDQQRNAIGCVFDLTNEKMQQQICSSGFDGLDVISLTCSTALLENALIQPYDVILVYAPQQTDWPVLRERLAGKNMMLFLFGAEQQPVDFLINTFDFSSHLILIEKKS